MQDQIPARFRINQQSPLGRGGCQIDYRLERGTFDALMQKHAISFDGLSVLVGRHHDPRYPDQLYVRVQMPPDAKQFTVVLAWKDRDELRHDGEDNDRSR